MQSLTHDSRLSSHSKRLFTGARPSIRRLLRFCAVLPILLTLSVVVPTATASAGVRGLDLQASGCDAQAPGTYIVLRANNVYGWKCHGFYDLGIDINQACRWTYGPGSSAYYLSYSNPYSWRCR